VSAYPPELAAHLQGSATTICHCWRLTRADGVVLGFTDHDRSLVVDGTTFRPRSGFSASEARDTLGLAIDTVDVEGALSSAEISEEDVLAGCYDDAEVQTLLVNWQQPDQFATLRRATVGRIVRRDGAFVAELKGRMHALDQVNGRWVSRRCDAVLGDARCRFDLDTPGFSATGVVLSLSAARTVRVSGLDGFATAWFAHGTIEWTTGVLAGRRSAVVGHTLRSGAVDLSLEPVDAPLPEPGDTFLIRAGCDKAFETCKAKFANALNFQGFPHLPGNDAAYGYVVDGDVFDGGPIVP